MSRGVGGWCSFQATYLTALGGHMHAEAGASPLEKAMSAVVSGTAMAGRKRWLVLPRVSGTSPGMGPACGSSSPCSALEFCMLRCTLSSTTTGLLSQSERHRDRGCSQALSAAPPVPVTNISVDKEVCLFKVIFSSLLPNDHRIKAA